MTAKPVDAQEILDPILDLFTGVDGGVGFAKLRHVFLPQLIKDAEKENHADYGGFKRANDMLHHLRVVGALCETMMNHKGPL